MTILVYIHLPLIIAILFACWFKLAHLAHAGTGSLLVKPTNLGG